MADTQEEESSLLLSVLTRSQDTIRGESEKMASSQQNKYFTDIL